MFWESFFSELEQASLVRNLRFHRRNVAKLWNRLVAVTADRGLRPVQVPNKSIPSERISWRQLPASFRLEADNYERWCGVPDPLDENARSSDLRFVATVNLPFTARSLLTTHRQRGTRSGGNLRHQAVTDGVRRSGDSAGHSAGESTTNGHKGMASKTITLSPGGTDYIVPALNLDRQMRVMTINEQEPVALIEILKIGLERATPKVSQPDEIEATPREIREAIQKLAALSGFKLAEPEQRLPHALR
jgi:hypothetical protein